MSIFDARITYAPFEYEQAYTFWEQQQQSHWLPNEINMRGDLNDWKTVLTEAERRVIGNTLKGFVQAETVVSDYWANVVARRFQKPEIAMMANTFASFEGIHAVSYALLNQTLGLEDFSVFLSEPSAKAKIDRLLQTKGKGREDVARSLAIFSAFTEGVSLFSSFAILLNFSRFNKMKGLGQIISFSILDESLHSKAGIWLYKQVISEFPEILTDEFKKSIYEAARLTVKLEDDFIDMAFELGPIEGLNKDDLKQFIRARANQKLVELGLKTNWKNVDQASIERMSWFDILSAGVSSQDFFAGRETRYNKGLNWDSMYE